MLDHHERTRFEQSVRNAFGAGARVTDVVPLHGDASSRRYVRLALARHPAVEAATRRVAAAEARIVQARSLEASPFAWLFYASFIVVASRSSGSTR